MELLTQKQATEMVKQQLRDSGETMTEFAKNRGLSKQHLRQILAGMQCPTPKVGFEKVPMFKPIRKKSKQS